MPDLEHQRGCARRWSEPRISTVNAWVLRVVSHGRAGHTQSHTHGVAGFTVATAGLIKTRACHRHRRRSSAERAATSDGERVSQVAKRPRLRSVAVSQLVSANVSIDDGRYTMSHGTRPLGAGHVCDRVCSANSRDRPSTGDRPRIWDRNIGRGGGIRTHGLFVPNFAQTYR
jgi:hypothetical protein